MLRAIYNLTTKVLIVTGNEISTFVEVIDEMGEWRTLCDTEGEPLYDVQLDFDYSIDETSKDTSLNPENYNVQFVNLIKLSEDKVSASTTYEMGHDWKNAELTIIRDKPSLEVIGVTEQFKFNPLTATFVVADINGKELLRCKSGNRASDRSVEYRTATHQEATILAIDDNGLTRKIK